MADNIKLIGEDNDVDARINKDLKFRGVDGLVEIGEEKFVWTSCYKDYVERIKKFTIRPDDVILAAFPRSGTTWTNEMLWLLVNNLDYENAKDTLHQRSPLLECSSLLPAGASKSVAGYDPDSFTYCENMKSPRCMKSHLPWPLLPEQITSGARKPKIITVMRNPQDVALSLYHYATLLEIYKGSYEDYFDYFFAGRTIPGPFWKYQLSYWEQRHRDNLLILKYKDMKTDLPAVVRQVAKFLGKSITEEQVQKLVEYTSFESMKKNPAVNYSAVLNRLNIKTDNLGEKDKGFIRSGQEGGYKATMTPELIARFEKWTKENTEGTGLVL